MKNIKYVKNDEVTRESGAVVTLVEQQLQIETMKSKIIKKFQHFITRFLECKQNMSQFTT